MPDSTPIYGLPFPTLTDDPNGPAQIEALASGVEGQLTAFSQVDVDNLALFTPHAVRVYRSAGDGASTIGTSTDVVIAFPSEKFDTDGYHSTSSNTARITIPTGLGGYYMVGGSLQIAAATGGARRTIHIEVNDSGSPIVMSGSNFNATVDTRLSISTLIDLSDGDYINLHAYQDSGGALSGVVNNPFSPSFWAVRIPFI